MQFRRHMSLMALHGWWCTVLVAACLLQCGHALPCARSGYCSIGKLKPFVGDITSGAVLRAALKARTYRQELIIMVTTSHRMVPTMQAIANLERLGLGHIMMISTDATECGKVAAKVPHIGCVWDSFRLPMVGPDIGEVVAVAPLWHTRWRTLARAVRLRYNVLCMDSDVIVFDDPYRYFKSPPFSNFTILDQPEVLYHQDEYQSNTFTNGGIVYVQNAAPDGPAAWLLAEVSDRLLRWIEDKFNTTRAHGLYTWCCYLDQDCFTDALSSVQTGRPFWHWALKVCTKDSYKESHNATYPAMVTALDSAVEHVFRSDPFQLPGWMHEVSGENASNIRWFPMRMPNVGQGVCDWRGCNQTSALWPPEFGGNLYPPVRGNLSRAFLHQLQSDCDCPLWPNPEDPSPATLTRARATPLEKFGFLPPWTVLGYMPRGRLGYWNPQVAGSPVPQQVIGHAHYIPDTDASVGKNVMKMLTGHYDWGLAEDLSGENGVYFANQWTGHMPDDQRSHVTLTLPRLIALHPRVDQQLAGTNSWEEYLALLLGLAQAAHLSHRTVLWPDPPCTTPWINERSGRVTHAPMDIRQEWMPWASSAGSSLSCSWMYLMLEACLFDQRGMLMVEYKHYYERYRLKYNLDPGRHNTAFVPGAHMKGLNTSGPAASQIIVVSEEAATSHLSNFTQDQIVYIGHPIQILLHSPAQVAQWTHRFKDCSGLQHRVVEDLSKNDPFQKKQAHRVKLHVGRIRKGKLVSKGVPLPVTARVWVNGTAAAWVNEAEVVAAGGEVVGTVVDGAQWDLWGLNNSTGRNKTGAATAQQAKSIL